MSMQLYLQFSWLDNDHLCLPILKSVTLLTFSYSFLRSSCFNGREDVLGPQDGLITQDFLLGGAHLAREVRGDWQITVAVQAPFIWTNWNMTTRKAVWILPTITLQPFLLSSFPKLEVDNFGHKIYLANIIKLINIIKLNCISTPLLSYGSSY